MIDYANYVKEQKTEDPASSTPNPPAPILFQAGEGDLPLLPPPVQGVRSEEIAKLAKEIIRAYFLKHYRKSHKNFILTSSHSHHLELATGSESARTPWAQIGDDPSQFFDIACLPTGFKFQDPSRMGVHVKSLLSHLRQRQEELGVKAFQFHHILKLNLMEPADYPPAAKAALSFICNN